MGKSSDNQHTADKSNRTRSERRTRRVSFDIDVSLAEKWEEWLRQSEFDFIGYLLRGEDDQDLLPLLAEYGIKIVRNNTVKINIPWRDMQIGEEITVMTVKGVPSHDNRVKQFRTLAWINSCRLEPKKFGTRIEGEDFKIVRLT